MTHTLEIEYKLLVTGAPTGMAAHITQAYLATGAPQVRVRRTVRNAVAAFELTVKGAEMNGGAGPSTRPEVNVPISVDQGEALIALCTKGLTKTRYTDGLWHIDVFEGALAGVMLAETELASADDPIPALPASLRAGPDVSLDPRFKNDRMATLSPDEQRALAATARAMIEAALR